MLKLLSLNIEEDNHFDKFIPVINQQSPDVILMQEVFAKDIEYLEKNLNKSSIYVPTYIMRRNFDDFLSGNAILTNLEIIEQYEYFYRGDKYNPPILYYGQGDKMNRALTIVKIKKDENIYTIAHTHFTWSDKGEASDIQRTDLFKLNALLERHKNFVLVGDFNAPRGREIFNQLSSKYQDNIPDEITTTLDPDLHRAGSLNLVVDGIFTTELYHTYNVKVISGVSDHCALVANIDYTS